MIKNEIKLQKTIKTFNKNIGKEKYYNNIVL